MPVRINLLPKYVLLKKYFQWLLKGCIGVSILWVLILALIYANTQIQINTLKLSIANVEPNAQATEAAQTAQKNAENTKAPIDANVKFILAASQTGAERSSLLDLFRPYIYPGSVVSQIDVSDGKSAVIQGMVKSPDDYARFITSLRQGTAPTGPLFAKLPVGTNGVPGFPQLNSTTTAKAGDNKSNAQLAMVVFPLTVGAKGDLLNPITVPVAPGSASRTNSAGAGAPVPPPGEQSFADSH
ncbi:MAG: hypothetical protein ABI210_03145 [Abditibacteriaceae bacterium]